MMEEMNKVFEKAKKKAIAKCGEPKNTEAPWKDFGKVHLMKRLEQEFKEYVDETWDDFPDDESIKDELLDIINLATFVYLAY